MKLLLISADFPPIRSGEASHAFSLGLNLARRGIDVHILTSTIEGVVTHPSLTVHPVMRSWSWMTLPYFAFFLKRCAPDGVLLLFLGNMYNDHPMMTFAPTISKIACPSMPFVTQFENCGICVWKTSFWTRLLRKGLARWVTGPGTDYNYGTLLRDSDRVVVLSDMHKMTLTQHFSQLYQKCVLIPPPPTITVCPDNGGRARVRGRAALGIGEDEFLLVYYGYMYPGKGIETLLQAFQTVAHRQSNARLAIVGDFLEYASGYASANSKIYTKEIQSLPHLLGIADRVSFTGPCPPETEEGSLYLQAADICVLPFDHGIHLNNSSFAAAAVHGLPIVTTKGEMLEEPFIHEENVFLCPPKDPEALADAIELLRDYPDLRKRLQRGVRTLTQDWFSWERATDRILETFCVRA